MRTLKYQISLRIRYFAHAQDDPNLRVLLMFEGTVSLDVDHMVSWKQKSIYFVVSSYALVWIDGIQNGGQNRNNFTFFVG